MFRTVFLSCADDGIGRFDTSMLSQQILMEIFIFALDNVEDICGSREKPTEVCTWKGIKCNDDGKVEAFGWAYRYADGTGTMDFKFLPRSMTRLNRPFNALSGKIDLADLAENMGYLRICSNELNGTLHLDDLHALMKKVICSKNAFTGEISLKRLPKCLNSLDLSIHKLKGTVCLTSLPPDLESLHLDRNTFEGSLDLTRLPQSLGVLICSPAK
ncbi:leucine-rich repeat protein [Perkinsela sp. CCAP 1560/4]|nr:leucine-rich repeat protein [Perkinsela sp. CCAP 1560/4]|eukprot:KNH03899.1 leucine-rich repeat protein [Perkinsela sp. CCAP 1560/4]